MMSELEAGPLDASRIVAESITAEDALRQIKAEVWDEGYRACLEDGAGTLLTPNPYRGDRMEADRT